MGPHNESISIEEIKKSWAQQNVSISFRNIKKIKSNRTTAKSGTPEKLTITCFCWTQMHMGTKEKKQKSSYDRNPCRFFIMLMVAMVGVMLQTSKYWASCERNQELKQKDHALRIWHYPGGHNDILKLLNRKCDYQQGPMNKNEVVAEPQNQQTTIG